MKWHTTVTGGSPPTRLFWSIFEGVLNTLKEEKQECEENLYYCLDIITFLLENYMAIFLLWSGYSKGTLKCILPILLWCCHLHLLTSAQHEILTATQKNGLGLWKLPFFAKKYHLRPLELICAMFTSLEGQYREYILSYNLPKIYLADRRSHLEMHRLLKKGGLRDQKKRGKHRKSCFFKCPTLYAHTKNKRQTWTI